MHQHHNIIQETSHRPWPMPEGPWRYCQEWNNALFLHWQVPENILRVLVPEGLQLDTLSGQAWVSLVAFTMQHVRPRYIPAFKPVSDFHELNLRTYVVHDGKAGVYFFSLEAQKSLSAFIARKISGLPYIKSAMYSMRDGQQGSYHSENIRKGFLFEAQFDIENALSVKSGTDQWLTERYCLYLEERAAIYRYDIHHLPWPLRLVALTSLRVHYRLQHFDLAARAPDLVHYSPGVKVLAWSRQKL